MKQGFVYFITNWTHEVLYVGVTSDLEKRFAEHQSKMIPGFSKKYNLNKLVYYECFPDIENAILREKQIKKWGRRKKDMLVVSVNPEWFHLHDGKAIRSLDFARDDKKRIAYPLASSRAQPRDLHSMKYLYQIPHIREGIDHLLLNDHVFKKLDIAPEHLTWRYIAPGYDSLVRIVIGQQVSTKAAQSIWEKFQKEFKTLTPAAVMKRHDDDLRALGLSGQKVKYIRGLSEAIHGKSFDPHALENLSDLEVYETITALKGFGRWSAEMYLMFSLARPDIWAPADLGIQNGLKIYHRRSERPDAAEALKMGKKFAPHRTAASILLWHLTTIKP